MIIIIIIIDFWHPMFQLYGVFTVWKKLVVHLDQMSKYPSIPNPFSLQRGSHPPPAKLTPPAQVLICTLYAQWLLNNAILL